MMLFVSWLPHETLKNRSLLRMIRVLHPDMSLIERYVVVEVLMNCWDVREVYLKTLSESGMTPPPTHEARPLMPWISKMTFIAHFITTTLRYVSTHAPNLQQLDPLILHTRLLTSSFRSALRRLLTLGLMHPHRFVLHFSLLVLVRLLTFDVTVLSGLSSSSSSSSSVSNSLRSHVERLQLRSLLPELQSVWALRTRLFSVEEETTTPTSTTTHGYSSNLQLQLLFLSVLRYYVLLFPQVCHSSFVFLTLATS